MKNTSKQNRPSSKNKHNRGKNCLLFDEFQDQKTGRTFVTRFRNKILKIQFDFRDTYLKLVLFPSKRKIKDKRRVLGPNLFKANSSRMYNIKD